METEGALFVKTKFEKPLKGKMCIFEVHLVWGKEGCTGGLRTGLIYMIQNVCRKGSRIRG